MKLLTLLAYGAGIAQSASVADTRAADIILYPAGTYRYWVQSGKIIQDPQDQLLIVKNGKSADETTTIVTFDFPQSSAGKTCELLFELWDRDVSTGSKTLDVFTYSNPPIPVQAFSTADVVELVSTKSRDNHGGRESLAQLDNS